MLRTAWFLALGLAVLTAAPAQAEAGLGQQIRDMITASRRMDYQGILVHGMAMGIESMHFYHAGSVDGAYRERLVMLTGPARELVRDGESVRRYHPDSQKVVTGPQRRGSGIFKLSGENLERIRRNYRIQPGPAGRVAGREVKAVEFRARDDKRFSYRIWRDRTTDLPLQTEVLGEDSQVRETFMFAVVQPGVRPSPEQLALNAPEGVSEVRRRRLPIAGGPQFVERIRMPPGFRLEGRYGGPGGEGEHLFYSDGLATLSIFLDPVSDNSDHNRKGNGAGCEILRRGALHACSLYHQEYRVTLLGEVPAATLRRIAESVTVARD